MSETVKSIYGLMGYPVSQSLSPLMHNAAFKALGVDAAYELFALKPEELAGFFRDLKKKDSPIFGLNVTVPYKEKAIEFMDSLSPYVQKAMAVNTIVIGPDRSLRGFNTDGPGFLTHLTELGFHSQGKRIAILGAGGSARGILTVLCLLPQRPQWIRIYNVHPEKAERLLEDLKNRMDVSVAAAVSSIDALDIKNTDLLINATPVGMKKDDPSLIEEGLLHSRMLVYDLVYNVAETKLLKLAKKKGAKVSNGLGMLLYQGVLAFEHWANAELDEDVKTKMRKSLLTGLHR